MELPSPCYIPSTSKLVAELKWTIKNFGSKEVKEKEMGEFCQSPNFSAPGDDSTKWYMRIYPNGVKESEKEGVSFLVFPEVALKSDCEAKITFTMLNEKSGMELFSAISMNYKFIASSKLGTGNNKSKEPFLSIENLVVRCKLEYEMEKLVPSSGDHPDLAADMSRSFSTTITDGDVTFIVDEKEFQAHKFILKARSPVLAAMFQYDMKEAALNRVDIVDIDPDVFQALLRFIYTDQEDLTEESSKALLTAANRYFLDLLKWKCESFLIKAMTIENCCELLMLADVHGANNLKEAAVNFIRKSPSEVIKTNGWKEMKKTCRLAWEFLETLLLEA